MSFLMKVTRTLLSFQANTFRSAETVQLSLAKSESDAPIPSTIQRLCLVSESSINGNRVITLTPRKASSGIEIVYVHGGAYIHPIFGAQWHIIRCLIQQTGATVTVPSYGLAPQHTVKEAYPFLDTVYDQVVARAADKQVYLAGDSAGGGLCLGMAIRYRDQNVRLPDSLFLFSPFLDVTLVNPDIEPLRSLDPMLDVLGLRWCGEQWADGISLTDPSVSPLYDSLENLPPTYVYQGGHDIFVVDVKKLAAKAKNTNTQLDLHIYPEGFHVFVGATFTIEAIQVFRHIGQVVHSRR